MMICSVPSPRGACPIEQVSVWAPHTCWRLEGFGDTEAYKDKFRTCSRSRTLDNQQLGASFYCKEHSKPLFETHKILAIHNLYSYHCFMEVFRILKFQSPTCIFYQYQPSQRKYLTYISLNPPTLSDIFIYRSSVLWNQGAGILQLFRSSLTRKGPYT